VCSSAGRCDINDIVIEQVPAAATAAAAGMVAVCGPPHPSPSLAEPRRPRCGKAAVLLLLLLLLPQPLLMLQQLLPDLAALKPAAAAT